LLTVLPTDKGNAFLVLGTSDFNEKIATVLEAKAYANLEKDPEDSMKRETVLLRKFPFAADICQQLQQRFRPHRPYMLLKIHKSGVPLTSIVNSIISSTYLLAKRLDRLLSCQTGHSSHHVKISIEFVHVLNSLQVDTRNIMLSLEVVSLFTKVRIKETMNLLGHRFEQDVLGLFRLVLTTPYFTFNGQFFGQTDGVVMGPALSPVIANFYMEDCEKTALESSP
jgi:hypothetical protein